MKKLGLYEWSVLLFFLIVPIAAILIECYAVQINSDFKTIAFKWFVFSGIGLRLFSSGIKQILQPKFTAQEIFNLKDEGAVPIVRELGFANVCFGTIAIISLIIGTFRIPAAIAGGLYFALAGIMHILKREIVVKKFLL